MTPQPSFSTEPPPHPRFHSQQLRPAPRARIGAIPRADVAKLADAPDLGSGFRKEVKVQVLSSAPFTAYPFILLEALADMRFSFILAVPGLNRL